MADLGPIVSARILGEVGQDVVGIVESTRQTIAKMVEYGIDNGFSAAQLGEFIEKGAGFGEYRAEVIARTETNRALNLAQVERYKEFGVRLVKVYDGDDDEECRERQSRDNGWGPGIYTVEEAANIRDHPNGTMDWSPITLTQEPQQNPTSEQNPTPDAPDDLGITDMANEASDDVIDGWARRAGVAEPIADSRGRYIIEEYTKEGYAYQNAYQRGMYKPKYDSIEQRQRLADSGDMEAIRSNKRLPTKQQLDNEARLLEDTMAPLKEDVVVYRRLSIDWDDELDPFVQQFGRSVEDALFASAKEPAFMSTSLKVTDRIAGEYLYRIRVPKGTKAVYARPHSSARSEYELIIERDRQMTVTGWHEEEIITHGVPTRVTVVEMELAP